MEYYWKLVLKDDSEYTIKPQAVDLIRKRMAEKAPINLRTRTVPFSEVKDFRQTDKAYHETPLLEGVSQAFGEPVYTQTEWNGRTYEGILARWVKRRVTPERWQNYHAKTTDRRLGEEDGMVVIAYKLPVHSIDLREVQYCTPEEVQKLDNSG